MSRRLVGLITAVAVIGAGSAYAQETSAGPGKVEVTVIPGGSMYFTDHNNGTPFTNSGTAPIDTEACSSMKAAPERPAAAMSRPQLGSPP